MKKVFGYFGVLFVFAVLMSVGIVVGDTAGDILLKSLSSFFNSLDFTGNLSIILFGILLWMVLYSIFRTMNIFERNNWWSGGASLIVTILAFNYTPQGFLDSLGPLYASIGGTILTVIPFAIAIYFTVFATTSFLVARSVWVVFTLYYLVIFLYIYFNIDEKSEIITIFGNVIKFYPGSRWFYAFAFLASVILFFTIAPLRKAMWNEQKKSIKERINRKIDKASIGLEAGSAITDVFSGKKRPNN